MTSYRLCGTERDGERYIERESEVERVTPNGF